MKIVLPGGSGQVGTILARAFHRDGHEAVVLTRKPETAPWRTVAWDGASAGAWASEFEGADAVINLSGRSVNYRYHAANRKSIMDSRVLSTRAVGQAIAQAKRPPRAWLQASTATIYVHRFDAAHDEAMGVIGGNEPNAPDTWNFSIDVATTWEKTAREYESKATRLVLLRSAVTLSPDRGGIFDVMLGLVRKGLGGTNGSGTQFVSWIHQADFVRAIYWILEHEDLAGPVNLSAPNPLPNAEFMRAFRQAWGTRIGLPAFAWMIEIGAVFMRTESELVLKSRRVVPGKLLQSGFAFQYPEWPAAAKELCDAWRAARK
ncbi:MAG: TIGR01777 family oxidoreductase [Gemmatimonadaceae bacterium]|nr:TIGR01777 family oxidoreductase [Gemmatimonadaceae bacterium]